MTTKEPTLDLREMLIDAHAHFFFLQAKGPQRLRLREIREDALVVDRPSDAAMHRTVVGLIPTLDGRGVYEIEGTIDPNPLPGQPPETVRVHVAPEGVRRVNRRQYPRAHFAPPVEADLVLPGEATPIRARVINLSAGGIRLEVDRELPVDHPFRITFEVECDEEIHEVVRDGAVKYEFPIEEGFAYGVKFVSKVNKEEAAKEGAPLEEIEQTVDLLDLVNRLLVWK